MSFQHQVSLEEKRARVTGDPPISIDDIQQSIRRLHAEAGFQPDFRVLIDLQRMDFQPSNDEILIIAETLGQNAEYYRNRIAMVVDDDLQYGLMRMATSYAEAKGLRISVFRDLESAEVWLEAGVPTASES